MHYFTVIQSASKLRIHTIYYTKALSLVISLSRDFYLEALIYVSTFYFSIRRIDSKRDDENFVTHFVNLIISKKWYLLR